MIRHTLRLMLASHVRQLEKPRYRGASCVVGITRSWPEESSIIIGYRDAAGIIYARALEAAACLRQAAIAGNRIDTGIWRRLARRGTIEWQSYDSRRLPAPTDYSTMTSPNLVNRANCGLKRLGEPLRNHRSNGVVKWRLIAPARRAFIEGNLRYRAVGRGIGRMQRPFNRHQSWWASQRVEITHQPHAATGDIQQGAANDATAGIDVIYRSSAC